MAVVVSLVTDSGFWADDTTSLLVSRACFLVVLLGAVGSVVEDRARGLGARWPSQARSPSALILCWAVLPILLGIGAAVVAVLRARALSHAAHGGSVATA